MPFQLDSEGNVVAKINGEEKKYSPEEFERLLAEVQKGVAASQKFEEAARMRTEAENKVAQFQQQVRDWLVAADAGDATAFARLLELQGVTGDRAAHKMRVYQQLWDEARANRNRPAEEEEDEDVGEEDDIPTPTPARRKQVGIEDLDPSLQELIRSVIGEKHEKTRNQVFAEAIEALEKDPVLGKLMSKGGPRAEKLREFVKERVKGRIRDGEEYGPKLLQAVTKESRELVEALGAWGSDDSISVPGLGPGPSISHAESQVTTPPELKPLDDPEYGKGLLSKMAYIMRFE